MKLKKNLHQSIVQKNVAISRDLFVGISVAVQLETKNKAVGP